MAAEEVVFKTFPQKVRIRFISPCLRSPCGRTRFCEYYYPTRHIYHGSQLTVNSREIQKLIDSTYDASSPFHISNAHRATDVTVYPTPTPASEPESKKRKLDTGDAVNGITTSNATVANDARHAKHPGLMLSNKHTVAIHEQLKRECEILAELCVRFHSGGIATHSLIVHTGQGEALDQLVNAQVSVIPDLSHGWSFTCALFLRIEE